MIRIYLITGLLSVMVGATFSQSPPWQLSSGSSGFRTVAFDVYQANPDTIYALGDSVIRSTNGGQSWETVYWKGTQFGALKVDPTNSQIVYVSWISVANQEANEEAMSTDGGFSWRPLFETGFYPTAVVEIDPQDRRTVYIGTAASLFRSTNHGTSWDTLGQFPATDLVSLAIAASNDSVLYVGCINGGVCKSTDRGQTWTAMPFVTPLQAGPLMAVNPRNPNEVYAAIGGIDTTEPRGVFKSTDGGQTWNQKSYGIPLENEILTIKIDPRDPNILWVGTFLADSARSGLLRSTDAGESWESFRNGIPLGDVGVSSLVIDTLHSRMFAGVVDYPAPVEGIYILDSAVEGVKQMALPSRFTLSQNFPNPFNPSTKITFSVRSRQHVRLDVFNILGMHIASVADGYYEMGEYTIVWSAAGQPSGVYFYRLSTSEFIETKRMILLK
jgi:photosystem II stability/assembly factor-like uncharacterized protein